MQTSEMTLYAEPVEFMSFYPVYFLPCDIPAPEKSRSIMYKDKNSVSFVFHIEGARDSVPEQVCSENRKVIFKAASLSGFGKENVNF